MGYNVINFRIKLEKIPTRGLEQIEVFIRKLRSWSWKDLK
jgi:hypothetical protein